MNRRLWRRCAAAAGAVALLTPVAVTAVSGSAAAAPAAAPALKLEAARKTVTAYTYKDGYTEFDPGIYAVAGDQPFEVRAYRRDYNKAISAWSVLPGADVQLPTGLVKDFNGLSDFFWLNIKDAKRKTVVNRSTSFCPNSYEAVRRSPAAPATSRYPDSCWGNPYSLGAVWGIQRGYGTPALEYEPVDLKPGTYTANLTVSAKYRTALKIKASDASATVTVKVVQARDDDEQLRSQGARRSNPDAAQAPTPTKLVGKAVKPSGPLPDLRSLPAWQINVEKGRYLNFAATVWNAGPSPLVVDGFRRARNEDVMDAYQYFFNASGQQVGYAPVGSMEWDNRDGHSHWHFTDFATYQLLDKNKKFVLRSGKEAFCLANTDAVDYTVKNANWKPGNTDLHTACGEETSIGVREVLDTGSGDTYGQYLPGQNFDLKGLPNGVYYILVGANPDKKLYESSTSNNNAYRKVTISGKEGHRAVKVAPVGVVVEPPIDDGEEE